MLIQVYKHSHLSKAANTDGLSTLTLLCVRGDNNWLRNEKRK